MEYLYLFVQDSFIEHTKCCMKVCHRELEFNITIGRIGCMMVYHTMYVLKASIYPCFLDYNWLVLAYLCWVLLNSLLDIILLLQSKWMQIMQNNELFVSTEAVVNAYRGAHSKIYGNVPLYYDAIVKQNTGMGRNP